MADIIASVTGMTAELPTDPAGRDQDGELWAPTLGFHGLYDVSTLGRVRSLPRLVTRIDGTCYMLKGRILRPASRQKGGYLHLVLRKDGKYHTRTVHRLVMEAFVGVRPARMQCCHANGNPSDNRLSNLRWDTADANAFDRDRIHCTGNQGFRNPRAYLTPDQIIAIRCANGTHTEVAQRFGVSAETARRIRNRIRWADVGVA